MVGRAACSKFRTDVERDAAIARRHATPPPPTGGACDRASRLPALHLPPTAAGVRRPAHPPRWAAAPPTRGRRATLSTVQLFERTMPKRWLGVQVGRSLDSSRLPLPPDCPRH